MRSKRVSVTSLVNSDAFKAAQTEAIDAGMNSPPQVGGYAIDELTAFGIHVHRQLSFLQSGTCSAVPDEDWAPLGDGCALDTSDFSEDESTLPVTLMGPLDVRVSAVRSDPPGESSPASFNVFALGATEIRNLASLRQRDDWGLWEPAVRKELDHAIKTKSALTFRTSAQMRAARRAYPDVFEILHLVTPCVVKHDADGNMSRRKFRVTVADVRGRPNSKFAAETYSGAIDGATVRYLAHPRSPWETPLP